jgi:hypothetical protein
MILYERDEKILPGSPARVTGGVDGCFLDESLKERTVSESTRAVKPGETHKVIHRRGRLNQLPTRKLVRSCEQLHFAVDGPLATLIPSLPLRFFWAYGIPNTFQSVVRGSLE